MIWLLPAGYDREFCPLGGYTVAKFLDAMFSLVSLYERKVFATAQNGHISVSWIQGEPMWMLRPNDVFTGSLIQGPASEAQFSMVRLFGTYKRRLEDG